MRYSDPKHLSSVLAILLALFFAIVYIVLSLVFGSFDILVLLGTGIFLFIFTFLILRYTINRFIYEKIKVIYKTIHNIRVRKDEDQEYVLNESLDDVNLQVMEWGEKQKNEIDTLKEQAAYRREFLGNVSHKHGKYSARVLRPRNLRLDLPQLHPAGRPSEKHGL